MCPGKNRALKGKGGLMANKDNSKSTSRDPINQEKGKAALHPITDEDLTDEDMKDAA